MAGQENPLLEFRRLYAMDWVRLVREVLGGNPDEKQQEILRAVQNGERLISVRSGHRVGKTTVLAWCIICHILTRFPQKTLVTAPTSGQLFDALAAETKAWINKLTPQMQSLFEIKSDRIEHRGAPQESFITFKTSSPETPEALAGVHSDNLLLIADEASGVHEKVFEAAAGSMAGHHATTLLAGNPVRTSGLFFDTFHKLRDLWHTIHISCVGHPRIAEAFIDDMRRRYGEESNQFRVRVLGEFPTADDDTIIPFELIESSLRRDVKATNVRSIWGLDVARFGQDATALAKRKGNVLQEKTKEKRGYDTMQVVGWVKSEWDLTPASERPEEILVDVIGIGAGVVDRLIELKLPARGINVSELPAMQDRYRNLRSELWFKGRQWFENRDCNLAGDEGLAAELAPQKYKYHSNGKFEAYSKADMKKLGHPSPNKADAFLLTLASDASSASPNATTSRSWNTPLSRVLKGLV